MVLPMIKPTPSFCFLEGINCIIQSSHFSEPALYLVNRILNSFQEPKQVITSFLGQILTSNVNTCL